jgi:hypothetical protein
MNTKKMPGFTAEVSIYQSTATYFTQTGVVAIGGDLVEASAAMSRFAGGRLGGFGGTEGPILCRTYCVDWQYVLEACGSNIDGSVMWCQYWKCLEWINPCEEGDPV